MRSACLGLVVLVASCSVSGSKFFGGTTSPVIGRSYDRHIWPGGMSETPRDLSAVVVQALIVDDAEPSGYRTLDGTGLADGTFTIENVPDDAEFLLKLNSDYYMTTMHSLELRYDDTLRGSPEPQQLTAESTLEFDLTGLQPYRDRNGIHDEIEIDSFSLGYIGGVGPSWQSPDLPHNAQAWTGPFRWGSGFGVAGPLQLPDAAQADDIHISHLRTETLGSYHRHRVSRLVDHFETSSVTLANGATVPIAGSFSPVLPDRSITMGIDRSAYDSGFDESTTGFHAFSRVLVSLNASPILDHDGVTLVLGRVSLDDWSRSSSLYEQFDLTYGDPFPATWSRYLTISYSRRRWSLLPNTTNVSVLGTSSGFITSQTLFTGQAPSALPVILPPTQVQVAGNDSIAGGLVAFDGQSPVEVTWATVTGAKIYTVSVQRVYANGDSTATDPLGSVTTDKTSIKLPAEIFGGSEFFVVTVKAIQSPANYGGGELIPGGLPHNFATAPGGMFRFSSKCGNGIQDDGEECDTMGESATCDIDCSLSKCGDGLRNATVGEACDSIRDALGCDSDCTPSACGDGYLNSNVEDCDDGDTLDTGNGCGTECKFTNICGDGVLESAAEECDSSGVDTATCDGATCTMSRCANDHQNTADGEGCDDGNFEDGDGCSSECMLE